MHPPAMCAVGELSRQQYQELKDAGADRYLLRIESSNPELYASIHPPSQANSGALGVLGRLGVALGQAGSR